MKLRKLSYAFVLAATLSASGSMVGASGKSEDAGAPAALPRRTVRRPW